MAVLGDSKITKLDLLEPLSVASGGTGQTSSPSLLTNLGSTSAADIMAASPRPGITGTLGLGNGGTGGTSATTARSNLGAASYINGLFYGVCSTAAATVAKTVTLTNGEGFSLVTGVSVVIKFSNNNTASSPTLNIDNTGEKALIRYGTTALGSTNATNGWEAGSTSLFTYDGTNWVRNYWQNSTYYYTSIYCTTAAGTAAKVGSISNAQELTAGKHFQVWMANTNSAASALTLNISSKGAKPIYINGKVSSSTNYTLPRGAYFVYYDGTNYYFYTDGTFKANKFIGDKISIGEEQDVGLLEVSIDNNNIDETIESCVYLNNNKTSFTGLLIENNQTSDYGLDIENYGSNNTGLKIYNNSTSNYGIKMTNGGTGIDLTNSGTGISISQVSGVTGAGLDIVNDIGNGININNPTTGTGINISNSSRGTGVSITNSASSSRGIYINNTHYGTIGINIANNEEESQGIKITNAAPGGAGVDIKNTVASSGVRIDTGTFASSYGVKIGLVAGVGIQSTSTTINTDHKAGIFVSSKDDSTNGSRYALAIAGKTSGSNSNSTYNASDLNAKISYSGDATFKTCVTTSGNDFAEHRKTMEYYFPGTCVIELGNGTLVKSTERLQAAASIVSDTYGSSVGYIKYGASVPVAVAGRVLADVEGDKFSYSVGDCVCSGSDGKVSKMTREEIKEYPDKIIGIVSEIPTYETWGENNIQINDRIWIKLR